MPLETDKRASRDSPDLAPVGNRAPLVTAIVPVWDQHSAFLSRCLRAINAQHVPVEIVVLDNASEYPIHAPSNTRVIRLPRRLTVGAARNAGLQLVTTPYIVFADADDELAPGSLARSIALLSRHPEAIAVIGRSIIDYGDRTACGIRRLRSTGSQAILCRPWYRFSGSSTTKDPSRQPSFAPPASSTPGGLQTLTLPRIGTWRLGFRVVVRCFAPTGRFGSIIVIVMQSAGALFVLVPRSRGTPFSGTAGPIRRPLTSRRS